MALLCLKQLNYISDLRRNTDSKLTGKKSTISVLGPGHTGIATVWQPPFNHQLLGKNGLLVVL